MLADTVLWQLDAEMLNVVPREGAGKAAPAALLVVCAASMRAQQMLNAVFSFFHKNKNPLWISFS